MLQRRICKQCGVEFMGGPRAYYCGSCRTIRRKESAAQYKARKKIGVVRQIGSIDICAKCGTKYTVNSGQQRFCLNCQKEHNLEYDRKTGIKFYHLHKDKINHIRNIRRQKGVIKCEWCGKEFITHTRQTTCCVECNRKMKNHKWNIRRKQK